MRVETHEIVSVVITQNKDDVARKRGGVCAGDDRTEYDRDDGTDNARTNVEGMMEMRFHFVFCLDRDTLSS